jgi:glycosyltransferase involved in cell wall biosynthesis
LSSSFEAECMQAEDLKVVILAPANSVHTHRWVEALHRRGHHITLVSQHDPGEWRPPTAVRMYRLPHSGALGYFRNAPRWRRLLRELEPDLVSAHYASGYGTTSAIVGFRPTLLSVWGTDVFEFPFASPWHRALLRFNLRRASRIASTSRIMAARVQRLEPAVRPVFVTPFGVDCDRFRPGRPAALPYLTVGTVKTLDQRYGVDLLIRAFARLQQDDALTATAVASRLRLLLVGTGAELERLRALADEICEPGTVDFAGPARHDDVPSWLARLDVYVAASRYESFGVAVVEASACGVPVVVSDVGGLPEVVRDGETGLVVPCEDVDALALAIKRLVLDGEWRRRLGAAGREFVCANYDWEHCVDVMEAAYRATIAASSHGDVA